MTPSTRKLGRRQTRRFGYFWPFSCAIAHSFLAPGMISTDHDPEYTKIGTSSKVVDLVISDHFRGYRTRFLSPGTNSIAHDPGYTKIETSSKLVDLIISGRFRGL